LLISNEVKHQHILWRLIDETRLITNQDSFEQLFKTKEAKIRFLQDHTTSIYTRKISVLEQAILQGVGFLKFPTDFTIETIHAMLGNSFPPGVASRIMHGIQDALISSNKSQHNLKGIKRHKTQTWQNKTILDLFAGLGGISMGVDYVDDWVDYNTEPTIRNPMSREPSGTGTITKPLDMDHLLLVDSANMCYHMLCYSSNTKYCKWSKEVVVHCNAMEIDYRKYQNKVGLLTGGPPCQPFSMTGKRGGLQDAREGWHICAKALLETEAETFMFENVWGISMGSMGKETVSTITQMLSNPWLYFKTLSHKEGQTNSLRIILTSLKLSKKQPTYKWQVSHEMITCSDYNVPQNRKRMIFIGFRVPYETSMTLNHPYIRVFEYVKRYKKEDTRHVYKVISETAGYNDSRVARGDFPNIKKMTRTFCGG
jgi:site-specific DNA-cytosine methylase